MLFTLSSFQKQGFVVRTCCQPQVEREMKRTRAPALRTNGVRIIDADAGLPDANPADDIDAFYAVGEDAPAVVAPADERTGKRLQNVPLWRELQNAIKAEPQSERDTNSRQQYNHATGNDRKTATRNDSDSDLSPERGAAAAGATKRASSPDADHARSNDTNERIAKRIKREPPSRRRASSSDSDLSPARPGNAQTDSNEHSVRVKTEDLEADRVSDRSFRYRIDERRSHRDNQSHRRSRSPNYAKSATSSSSRNNNSLSIRHADAAPNHSANKNSYTASRATVGLIKDVSSLDIARRRKMTTTDVAAGNKAEAQTTVYRDRGTGRKIDTKETQVRDAVERERKADDRKKLIEKYALLNRGMRQVDERHQALQEMERDMAKPLARSRDDKDLDRHLRDQPRLDDPMQQYMERTKQQRKSRFEPEPGEPEEVVTMLKPRPVYRGAWPCNRFNIAPGARWDGVDRSNGFEQKYFKAQASKRATAEQALKWSTEEM